MHTEFTCVSANHGHEVIKQIWAGIKPMLEAGTNVRIIVTDEGKNYEQNKKYHAMIGEIAQQAQHLGSKWSADDWKRLLIQQFMEESLSEKSRIIPSLSGNGIVQLGFQSRKFTKQQASDFIEFLNAWGAENGVTYAEN